MRDDEEYAKKLLFEHLCLDHEVEVQPGSEPPDYFFIVNGVRYATEVTRIGQARKERKERKEDLKERMISRISDERAVFDWIDAIEQKAKKAGVLSGAYILSFLGSLVGLSRRARARLEQEVLEYVTATGEMERAETTELAQGDPVHLAIAKTGTTPDVIGGLVGISSTQWSSDIQANADAVLKYAVGVKKDKLEGVTEPCLLLLINAYPLAAPGNYLKSAAALEDDAFFRGIFLIDTGRCHPLRPLVIDGPHL